MAKLTIKKGSTDVTLLIWIADSSVTTGAGLTGLAYNTASLVCYYHRPLAASATALSLATLAATNTAHSDGGFKEVDATNMPGLYRLDLSDAIVATGVNSVVVMLKGATNMVPVVLELELVTETLSDTKAEATGVPAATASLADKINFAAALARNKITQTATTQTLFADDGSTTVATSTHSDDATTHTKGEFV